MNVDEVGVLFREVRKVTGFLTHLAYAFASA